MGTSRIRVVDSWSDCGNAFNAYDGLFHVEMLFNGWARVDDRRSGLVTLVDPVDGAVRHGSLTVPGDLVAEIVHRWGR